MNNKIIFLLLQNFDNGGVQRILINLEIEFTKMGHQVYYVVAQNKGELKTTIDNKKILDCKVKYGYGDLLPFFAFSKVNKFINFYKPNTIIASPGTATITNSLYKKYNKNNFTAINIVDNKISLMKKGSWHHKISLYLFKKFYKNADYIVAAHNNAANDIINTIDNIEDKVKMIYHPLVLDSAINFNTDEEEIINDPLKPILLMGMGRLVEEKDFTTLIESTSILIKKYKLNVRLEIYGNGPLLDELKNKVKELDLENNVFLLGYVDNPLKYLAKADLFVLSSKQEAFGNVIVEALSQGTYVVSTDCDSGGPAEILDSEKYGLLTEVGEPNKMAITIKRALQLSNEHSPKHRIERSLNFSMKESSLDYLELM